MGRQVLYLVIGPVEGGTDQVVHAAVEDEKVPSDPFLHIYHPGNQGATLGNQGPAGLHMDLLVAAPWKIPVNCPEPCFEIRNRVFVRVFIIHPEASAHIDRGNPQSPLFEKVHEFRSAVTLIPENLLNVKNLGSDMELQPDKTERRSALYKGGRTLEIDGSDAELILRKTGSHILVGMGVHSGIDPYLDGSDEAVGRRPAGYDFKLLHRLAIEGADTL